MPAATALSTELASGLPAGLVSTLAQMVASDDGAPLISANTAFFNTDAMVHRTTGAYLSVRMRSLRTQGNEDFQSRGKTWFAGSGMLQARVHGDEYDYVRARYDWHVLPGVTDEWRTDALPRGTSGTNRCGGNAFAAVASDGELGAAAFESIPHPDETKDYSVARSLKAYFFHDFGVVALGNSISRIKTGQGRAIVTTLDQARWRGTISYQPSASALDEPVTLPFSPSGGCATLIEVAAGHTAWLHQGAVGYIVRAPPSSALTIELKCGITEVRASDSRMARSSGWGNRHGRNRWDPTDGDWYRSDRPFLAVIHHGSQPTAGEYVYAVLPNVTATQMHGRAASFFTSEVQILRNDASVQAVADVRSGPASIAATVQTVFLVPHASVALPIGQNGELVNMTADASAVVQMRRINASAATGHSVDQWSLVATEGTKNGGITSLRLEIEATGLMRPGAYGYVLPGVEPRAAIDHVVVSEPAPARTLVDIGLPDTSDDAAYDFMGDMYLGAPVSVVTPRVEPTDAASRPPAATSTAFRTRTSADPTAIPPATTSTASSTRA